MMQNQLVQLDLGPFSLGLPERWDAHFFPKIETKLRLVKDDCTVLIEHYLVPQVDSENALDLFFEDHILELKQNVNGIVFDAEEDTDYEILVENNGEFRRYFFLSAGSFIFRFTLSGFWEPLDEDEVRSMIAGLTVNSEPSKSTDRIVPANFEFDYNDWFRLGAMYSKRGGL